MQSGVKPVKLSVPSLSHLELASALADEALHAEAPGPLLNFCFERLQNDTAVDVCLVYLLQDGRLELSFASGFEPHTLHQFHQPEYAERIAGGTLRENAARHEERIQEASGTATGLLRDLGIAALSSYPLFAGSGSLGCISFGSRVQPLFANDEITLQRIVASLVAGAVERKLVEEELVRKAQRLAAAHALLRRANADLEQVAFSASHDFREPVRHLGIFAELLARKLGPQLDEESETYLRFISTSARRLDLLVADFLELNRISGRGSAGPETDTSAVAARVISKLDRLIQETGAQIKVGSLPTLRASEEHVQILLEHLLENALLYRRPGVAPYIEISSVPGRKPPVICVRDNGLGIEPAHQHRVFDLFRQLNPGERSNSSGIGLTVCRRIVDQYNGHIWVESEVGEGALFCFTLGEKVSEDQDSAPAPDLSGRR